MGFWRWTGGFEFYCRGGHDGLSLRKLFVRTREETNVERSM
jgi:hypothetical protein